MIKRYIFGILIILLFTSCRKNDVELPPTVESRAPKEYLLRGKVIAVLSDDIFATVAKDVFYASSVRSYSFIEDMFEALRSGTVDAVLVNALYSPASSDSSAISDFDYLYVEPSDFSKHSAPIFAEATLAEIFNEWLMTLKINGVYEEIVFRWLGNRLPEQQNIPAFFLSNKRGVLRVCDTDDYPPYIYHDMLGNLTGFDMEMVYRFAQHLQMSIEVHTMPYEEILPFVRSGQADMSACLYDISEMEDEDVSLSMPVLTTKALLIVAKNSTAVPQMAVSDTLVTNEILEQDKIIENDFPDTPATVIEETHMDIDNPVIMPRSSDVSLPDSIHISSQDTLLIEPQKPVVATPIVDSRHSNSIISQKLRHFVSFWREYWRPLFIGLYITLLVAFLAQIFSTVFGGFLCYLSCRKNLFLKAVADIYCGFLSATPIVILLMLAYYIAFTLANVSSMVAAIIAFTLIHSAVVATQFTSAIHAVSSRETQATRCLGFSDSDNFFYICLPQTIRKGLHKYLYGFIDLVKATTIVGYITIYELSHLGEIIRSRISRAYLSLILLTIIYIVFSAILILLMKLAVRNIKVGDR